MFLLSANKTGRAASIARWQPTLRKIHSRDKKLESFTDSEILKESLSLRYRVQSGEPLDHLLVEAFALVCQAADRTLDMRHYDVQLMGGVAMHGGSVAVMQTGEGKTLAATLPLYLAALTGKGAHLVTANDYLAERDAETMRPLFEALGMTVGAVVAATPRSDRSAAYHSDITYSTSKEIGFDFLRDRLAKRRADNGSFEHVAMLVEDHADEMNGDTVQRELHFVVVDEADSILIDEARTPLIISSLPDNNEARAALYAWAAGMADEFSESTDYEYEDEKRVVELTPGGRMLVRKLEKPLSIATMPMVDIYAQVELALLVNKQFVRDRHYVVRDDEIVIVDEFTGRMTEGRKWRAGLHQAIEAREGVEITFETNEAARITVQDLFLTYDRLCGMTGTVANSARELKKIYGVDTVHIPTNKPPKRKQMPDQVFQTEDEKWAAIVEEIKQVHATGRPVLVGTRSIDKSELLSQLLDGENIEHDVLNARHLTREAEIISSAGQVNRITVATNMAGRGTDIKLSEESNGRGGLHVICSEVHESARIDRQLIGRCGRQGDPGTFRLFMSLQDDLLPNAFGSKAAERIQRMGRAQPLTNFAGTFRRAQQRIERKHFRGRKMLLYHERRRQLAQREMGQDPYVDTIV